jgi:hypothetical protein
MGQLAARVADPFAPALRAFCEVWEAAYGLDYLPTIVDCRSLRVLVNTLPRRVMGELPAIFGRYLQDMDPFVARSMRHNLTHFCTRGGVNKYRVSAPVLSAREASGVEAGRQFVNGEGNHAGK